MNVFRHYANYYDLLYGDKDYRAEALYVQSLLKSAIEHPKSILELGCGTGAHAQHLAEIGLRVHGVDISSDMLERAQSRIASLPNRLSEQLSFSQGDVRTLRLENQFDVVLSLFHVMSYQSENADLSAAFVTARSHLQLGGIFIFDCWYGPAVLTEQPVVRVKKLEDDTISVIRIAQPAMLENLNCVDVNYEVLVREKATGITEILKETHRMRYLFYPEVVAMLEASGFELVDSFQWMTDKAPDLHSWNVCFLAKACDDRS